MKKQMKEKSKTKKTKRNREVPQAIVCFDQYNSLFLKIIDEANSKFDLKIKELLHINWTKPNINEQQTIQLSHCRYSLHHLLSLSLTH